jgi:hypothetical protein
MKFNSSFNLNVDFTRLSCSDPECTPNNATYPANLTLDKMSMAISQRFSVPDGRGGILKTEIQSVSISLSPDEVSLTFP